MMQIRTLVVDDEALARKRLRGFLEKISDIHLVGEAEDGRSAIEMISIQKPDLVFLDVQMPGEDGFSVLRSLEEMPWIVFATAYEDYAVKAFEVDAVDYLLKPFRQTRVTEAVARVRARMEAAEVPPPLDAIMQLERLTQPEGSRQAFARQIPAQMARKIVVLPVEDVLWFGVEARLVFAHVSGRSYMTNFTLRDLEERLDPEVFFRAHKSRIVNLARVKEITRATTGRYRLVLNDPGATEVELSRVQARALRERLGW